MRMAALFALVLLTVSAVAPPREAVHATLGGKGRVLELFLQGAEVKPFFVQPAKIRLLLRPLDDAGRPRSLAPAPSAPVAATTGAPCRAPMFVGDQCFQGRSYVPLALSLPNAAKGAFAVTLVANDAVFSSGASPVGVSPHVTPALLYAPQLPDDIGLRDARRRYLGKTVYAMPHTVQWLLHCAGAPTEIEDMPAYGAATITGIERTTGNAETGTFQSPDGAFLAVEPLIVRIAASWRPVVLPPGLKAYARQPPAGSCANRFVLMADPWEIERNFALHDPRVRPDWPARLRQAVAHRSVVIGMTHEMVAAVLGYPAHYGTVAQLDRLTKWNYDAPTPFQSSVTFHEGRVTEYDPPGNQP